MDQLRAALRKRGSGPEYSDAQVTPNTYTHYFISNNMMRICESFSKHCSMRWKWSKHLYKFSFSLHVLQVVNWLSIKSVQLYELGIDQSFSFVKIYELGVNQSIFLTFLLVEDWLYVLCVQFYELEREKEDWKRKYLEMFDNHGQMKEKLEFTCESGYSGPEPLFRRAALSWSTSCSVALRKYKKY